MSAVDFVNYCVDGFYQLDYSSRWIFILALGFTIVLFSWIHLGIKFALTKIYNHFKNRGKDNA